MRHPRSIVAILFAIAVAVVTAAAVLVPREPKPSVLEEEVARYRAMGPAGVECFLEQYREELDQPSPPQELREALDRICAQRDCIASRLYWYTDFEQAKDAARSEGKLILSLRLLGNLDGRRPATTPVPVADTAPGTHPHSRRTECTCPNRISY